MAWMRSGSGVGGGGAGSARQRPTSTSAKGLSLFETVETYAPGNNRSSRAADVSTRSASNRPAVWMQTIPAKEVETVKGSERRGGRVEGQVSKEGRWGSEARTGGEKGAWSAGSWSSMGWRWSSSSGRQASSMPNRSAPRPAIACRRRSANISCHDAEEGVPPEARRFHRQNRDQPSCLASFTGSMVRMMNDSLSETSVSTFPVLGSPPTVPIISFLPPFVRAFVPSLKGHSMAWHSVPV